MDIKHLDYFREIVDSNFNLSKAANKLHITQPSLSMLVTNWEKEYGLKLFNKNKGRYNSLTREGEYIYNHSVQLLKMHNDFLYSLEELKRDHMGTIKLGVPSFMISLLLRNVIVDFMNFYPDISFSLVEEGSKKLQNRLDNGDLDIVIFDPPQLLNNLEYHSLFSDELVVVMNNALITTKENTVSLQDLEPEKMVIFSEEFTLYDNTIAMFKEQLLHPNIVFKASQWNLLLNLVNDTECYTIVPAPLVATISLENVTVKKLKNKVTWDVVLAFSTTKIKTPALRLFEEYVNNYFDNFNPQVREGVKPINIQ